VMDRLTPENLPKALEIAALPDQIRGYEGIKEKSAACVKKLAEEKLAELSKVHVGARAIEDRPASFSLGLKRPPGGARA
ncbi:MAG: hypothetical protein ACRD30_02665, partial [Bryobacteraceae bacterium]